MSTVGYFPSIAIDDVGEMFRRLMPTRSLGVCLDREAGLILLIVYGRDGRAEHVMRGAPADVADLCRLKGLA